MIAFRPAALALAPTARTWSRVLQQSRWGEIGTQAQAALDRLAK